MRCNAPRGLFDFLTVKIGTLSERPLVADFVAKAVTVLVHRLAPPVDVFRHCGCDHVHRAKGMEVLDGKNVWHPSISGFSQSFFSSLRLRTVASLMGA
jgi:hypothetical protein